MLATSRVLKIGSLTDSVDSYEMDQNELLLGLVLKSSSGDRNTG